MSKLDKICYILAVDNKEDYLKEYKDKKHIRHIQELFEKIYPVFTVTNIEEVTGWVCDCISPPGSTKSEIVLNLERADTTLILDGANYYTKNDANKYRNKKGTFII